MYNVNNYGYNAGSDCPTQNPGIKSNYLHTILKYAHPDIMGLVKMEASDSTFYTDSIFSYVLDSVCNKCYRHSAFTNKSGYKKANMLYYNSNKVGLISTTTIYYGDPNISDINLYKLYYRSAALATTHDTIFLNIILVHDKSGKKNTQERATEIGGAMSWLDKQVSAPGNYIFMGDFNVQTALEECYTDMIKPANTNVKFYDPVNAQGDWSANPADFANYITQSTRTLDPGDCSAIGGLIHRYDQILCTKPLIDGTDNLKYVSGSYKVIGQDGKHVSGAIINMPVNTAAPPNVITALYNMSEHLPVVLKLVILKK